MFKGKGLKYNNTKALEYASEAAGMKYGMNEIGGWRFHDIRATVKTFMMKAGVDYAVRSVLLGHSLRGMDLFYMRVSELDLKEAMDKYTEWFDRQVDSANVDFLLTKNET